jgi:DNA-binding CsgD family transcriptional regulator
MLAAAIEEARPLDTEFALRLEGHVATAARLHSETAHLAVERLRDAKELEGDTPGERALLATLAFDRMLAARPLDEAAPLAQRGLAKGLLDDPFSDLVFWDAPWVLVCADRLDEAQRALAMALESARRGGSLLRFARASAFRAQAALRAGAVAEAEADARAAVETASGRWNVAFLALAFLLDVLIERGDLDEAWTLLEHHGPGEQIPDNLMLNFLLHARGRVKLARGDAEGAVADLQEVNERLRAWGGGNPAMYPHRSSLAEALFALGRRDEALEAVREELEVARRWGAPRAVALALRVMGLIEGGEEGLTHLREAVATLEDSPATLEQARTLTELGAALRRQGERVASRDPLTRGLDLAHRCGATALEERAREELVATGARPRRAALSGVDALTASELRVARLAADGMTNREIAQALFVTPRTVETHLTQIYRKLDIESRQGLAAALAG